MIAVTVPGTTCIRVLVRCDDRETARGNRRRCSSLHPVTGSEISVRMPANASGKSNALPPMTHRNIAAAPMSGATSRNMYASDCRQLAGEALRYSARTASLGASITSVRCARGSSANERSSSRHHSSGPHSCVSARRLLRFFSVTEPNPPRPA